MGVLAFVSMIPFIESEITEDGLAVIAAISFSVVAGVDQFLIHKLLKSRGVESDSPPGLFYHSLILPALFVSFLCSWGGVAEVRGDNADWSGAWLATLFAPIVVGVIVSSALVNGEVSDETDGVVRINGGAAVPLIDLPHADEAAAPHAAPVVVRQGRVTTVATKLTCAGCGTELIQGQKVLRCEFGAPHYVHEECGRNLLNGDCPSCGRKLKRRAQQFS